jgi:hypothetical protein
MTTKLISAIYASGYSLASKYDSLLILSTGYIGGTGLKLHSTAAVASYGDIVGTISSSSNNGISAYAGATIKNGNATHTGVVIEGYSGIFATNTPVTITNYAEIYGVGPAGDGVFIVAGGIITNGADGDTVARIRGDYSGVAAGALATVANFGTILGDASQGVNLGLGGTVINGSATDATAEIYGQAGAGVRASKASATISNFGAIVSKNADGVDITASGSVTTIRNGDSGNSTASISGGASGVESEAPAVVTNFATISGALSGVALADGGTVINGPSGSATATISGDDDFGVAAAGAAATVTNYATIQSFGSGVRLSAGGVVTNGAAGDTAATIYGKYLGVVSSGNSATVTNFGEILASDTAVFSYGVELDAGGRLVNGSAADTAARIHGREAVKIDTAPATVINYGTVESSSAYAVAAAEAATVVNGSNADRSALLTGNRGVNAGGGTLRNFGTVTGTLGVAATNVGLLVNGSAGDLTALIQGTFGVKSTGGVVTNFATIIGGANPAVYLDSGRLTNGSATITSALISGGAAGIHAVNGASIANFATIASAGTGILLGYGCVFVNGAAGAAGALAEGATGVSATGAIIDNFGVIYGGGGVAVDLTSANNVLEVEAGCAFYGAVLGGGGTLDLASGSGTISSFAHGDAVVSGAIIPSAFSNFSTFEIGAAANFTLAGAGSLTAGRALTVDGSLTVTGTLSSAGSLTVTRTLTGAGTLGLTAGTATFEAGAALTIAKITQSGGVATFTAASLTVSHPWTQIGGIVAVSTGDKVSFTGAGDTFSGTLTGAGTIALTGGSDLLSGAALSAKTLTVTAAAVTLSGAISLSGALGVTSTNLAIATAGATLSGGGSLNLTNHASNAIKGAASTAILTNHDKITGAGTISNLVLVNQAGGIINGNQTTALIITTAANTIVNAGVIENTGAGGTTLKSVVANTGTLLVTAGALTANAAVTGAGIVKITGGVAHMAAAFSENVTFGSKGTLELARSASYTGKITGFSKTGTTSLDLLDIAFGGSTTAKFSGTTASGVLTVTDGTHTARITLLGNYTASTFTPSSDGHGGTSVVDPTAPSSRTPPLQPLVAAMAGFGSAGGQSLPAGAVARGPASWLVHAA